MKPDADKPATIPDWYQMGGPDTLELNAEMWIQARFPFYEKGRVQVQCLVRKYSKTSAFFAVFYLPFCFATSVQAETGSQSNDGNRAVRAEVPSAPRDGGPRRWQVKAENGVSLHREPSEGSGLQLVIADGTILSNFGCTQAEGRVWCQVRALHGKAHGFVAAEHLVPATAPDGTVPLGVDDSVKRARKGDFDARGEISCTQVRGQTPAKCQAGVARGTGGDATVVVTFSNGFARTLYFMHGDFISANSTMSGVGTDTDWRIENFQHFIRVDDQRYELPDALVFGK